MKVILGIISSCIVSLLTSVLFPTFEIADRTVSTLYTVTGIMFSVGASLLVTSNASNVPNEKHKRAIRNEIFAILKKYILCFAIVTVIYIVFDSGKCIDVFGKFQWLHTHILLCTIVYSIVYFILNFVSIQQINRKIDDKVSESS